jgi:hypothetical protein
MNERNMEHIKHGFYIQKYIYIYGGNDDTTVHAVTLPRLPHHDDLPVAFHLLPSFTPPPPHHSRSVNFIVFADHVYRKFTHHEQQNEDRKRAWHDYRQPTLDTLHITA